MRVKGLEPSHLAAPDPKSGVSTNFTTPASIKCGCKYNLKDLQKQNCKEKISFLKFFIILASKSQKI